MSKILTENLEQPDKELRKIYAAKIEEMLLKDKRIISMDGDLMRAISTVNLWKKYPEQVFECGIAEQNMIGVAAGLSSEGYIPFVHSFAAFNSRRIADQVFMSCAYAKLNVKIIGSDPGVVAQLNGGTHTANEDIAIMRSLPNVTVVDVTDAVALPQILEQAADQYGVFYIRIPRCAVPRVYADDAEIEIGRAETLIDGNDLTIIACGVEVHEAIAASRKLAEGGISARVIDMHTIQPLDKASVIKAAKETGAIVTAENHNMNGGLGSAVAECLSENCPVHMVRVANDRYGDVGTLSYLLRHYGLDADAIAEKSRQVLQKKSAKTMIQVCYL